MIVLLVAAIATLLAGVLAILIGVPVKEFSFGNTMILAGAMAMCTGLVLFGLWITGREMRALARRIAVPASAGLHDPSLPELSAPAAQPPFPSRPPARAPMIAVPPPPVHLPSVHEPVPLDEIDDRLTADLAPEPVPEPPLEPKPKARRNLLFESSVRKDRERAAASAPQAAAPAIETGQRTVFEEPAAPTRERLDRSPRLRSPSTFAEPQVAPPSAVTVLKSGVVDDMAYSLYSDGSIEAEMPEGTMRFASIEDLRTHLDQRGA